jgi:hypothetical protein
LTSSLVSSVGSLINLFLLHKEFAQKEAQLVSITKELAKYNILFRPEAFLCPHPP